MLNNRLHNIFSYKMSNYLDAVTKIYWLVAINDQQIYIFRRCVFRTVFLQSLHIFQAWWLILLACTFFTKSMCSSRSYSRWWWWRKESWPPTLLQETEYEYYYWAQPQPLTARQINITPSASAEANPASFLLPAKVLDQTFFWEATRSF